MKNTLIRTGLAAFIATFATVTVAEVPEGIDPKRAATIDGVTGPDYYVGVEVTDQRLIDLDNEVGLKGFYLRSRFVTVAPGGIIRLHQHKNRPAFTYVVNSEVVEYRNDKTGSGVRKAGDVTTDADSLVQWWRNDSDETVRLFVVDVPNKKSVNPGGTD